MRLLIPYLPVLCVLLCGCTVLRKEPYKAVNYYDLSYPTARIDLKGATVSVREVTADTPYADRMVFKTSANRVEIDEFNRWACAPAEMVSKYLTMTLDIEPAKYSLAVRVMQLEASLDPPAVRVAVLATVTEKANDQSRMRKIYRQDLPVEKVTGEQFAKTAETAIGRITRQIASDIAKLE